MKENQHKPARKKKTRNEAMGNRIRQKLPQLWHIFYVLHFHTAFSPRIGCIIHVWKCKISMCEIFVYLIAHFTKCGCVLQQKSEKINSWQLRSKFSFDIKGQAVSAGWRELNGLLEEKIPRYSMINLFCILCPICILCFVFSLYFEVKIPQSPECLCILR